ncbi:nuclear egress membrane protein [Beluga whale alphaherpesvirus 1]|uniref:Nuclear egress membrane protein n=1 Tax=Beluga whale alphaherpesvirus 1 TaxID=1434720 RepID=A0A286MM46_9ALPH|nr:nuclear egress membrane protein [Beluga whale alphaherpesvirus 1]ASW27072.1 nuclear egress membrane protein [Beluga whale alphaherpesvirus 1]
MRPYAADAGADAARALASRIKLLVPGGMRYGDGDAAPPGDPFNPPARCVFQCTGRDGGNECFPVEYVLRLMANWARVACDPYVRVQNTGVSVLIQGYFNPPPGAPVAGVTAEQHNVTLESTLCTGISLSALDAVKAEGGIDTRPFYAMMVIHCFVRMPRVQLAFRFMGPESTHRTEQLAERVRHRAVAAREARRGGGRSESPPRARTPGQDPPRPDPGRACDLRAACLRWKHRPRALAAAAAAAVGVAALFVLARAAGFY